MVWGKGRNRIQGVFWSEKKSSREVQKRATQPYGTDMLTTGKAIRYDTTYDLLLSTGTKRTTLLKKRMFRWVSQKESGSRRWFDHILGCSMPPIFGSNGGRESNQCQQLQELSQPAVTKVWKTQ
jgi:hypothetical protein